MFPNRSTPERLRVWAALLAVAAIAVSATPKVGPPSASAPKDAAVARVQIPETIAAAGRGEWLLVDVRPAPQRALGHIQGDVHIPLDQMAARQAELPRDRRLVFYCSCLAEELALDAARILTGAGHTRVAVLVGGTDAWRAAGGPFTPGATWDEIFHVGDAPAGWGKTPVEGGRCRYARDDSVAAKGTASARLGCAADSTARGLAGFVQRIDARVVRGRQVTFSAMVRSEKVAHAALVWVGAEDPSGRMIAMTRAEASPITGTQDWHPVEVTGAVPPAAAKVLVGISMMGAGSVWMDEARVVAPPAGALPRVRLVVENPSFED